MSLFVKSPDIQSASVLLLLKTPRIVAITAAGTPRTRRSRGRFPPPSHSGHRLFATRKQQQPGMSVSTASEALIKRNPHPDFKKVEASRPDWDESSRFRYTKTASPSWALGSGANALHDGAGRKHVQIDPYEPGRPAPSNYKLLISSIVPRPVGFVSTVSADGSRRNLAPFSYFQVVNHDPPLFVLGVASPLARPKDTLRHLLETRECVVGLVGEGFLEAANAASVDAPPGASEWDVSGLTPVDDCATVGAPRVGEAVFSVECKLESCREFESRATPGKKTGCLVVLEGTRFWVREDAINEERNQVDPEVLRPVSRLGGITYGRVTEAVELPRPVFEKDVGGMEGYEKLRPSSKLGREVDEEGEPAN